MQIVSETNRLPSENLGDIVVSVYCLTYNHEKYIRDALESFVSQQTTFKYEVLVHDDASTDGTADIIKEYAEKYPDIIKPIFQQKNQYSKGVEIIQTYIWPQMRGKYVAACEGDDYWSDRQKLQLQYEAMEQHPECTICSHYAKGIKLETNSFCGNYPDMKYKICEGIVPKNVQMEISLFNLFHLTSIFLRRDVYDKYMSNMPEYARLMPVGDVPLQLYFSKFGSMYFIDREMSVHLEGTDGSWTKRIRCNPKKMAKHCIEYREGLYSCKEFYNGEYSELFDKCICANDFEFAAQTNDYTALKNNISFVYHCGGLKWVIRVYFCSMFPFAEKIWYLLRELKYRMSNERKRY